MTKTDSKLALTPCSRNQYVSHVNSSPCNITTPLTRFPDGKSNMKSYVSYRTHPKLAHRNASTIQHDPAFTDDLDPRTRGGGVRLFSWLWLLESCNKNHKNRGEIALILVLSLLAMTAAFSRWRAAQDSKDSQVPAMAGPIARR